MAEISGLFERHTKVALHLSSGKDSAAVLWLLQPYWERLDVFWCDMGNPYPETVDYMARIAQLVPHFKVVKGNQPEWIRQKGWPVDVVPLDATELGRTITRKDGLRVQPFWDCCGANAWEPLAKAMKDGGYTAIIRGQKLSDPLQGPINDGAVVDGVEYSFPIATWTDDDVFEFLGDRVPDSYKRGLKTSLDCKNCTAYVKENRGRIDDLWSIDPQAAADVKVVHLYLKKQLESFTQQLGE